MALRKQEVRKVEAKAKPSRAVAYDEHGKVAKSAMRKLEATLLSSTAKSSGGRSAAQDTNGATNGGPPLEAAAAEGVLAASPSKAPNNCSMVVPTRCLKQSTPATIRACRSSRK